MTTQLTNDWFYVLGRFNIVYLFDMVSKELRRFEEHEAPGFRTELTDEEEAAIGDVFGFNWGLAEKAMDDDQLRTHKEMSASRDGLFELFCDQQEGVLDADQMAIECAKRHETGVVVRWGNAHFLPSEDFIPVNFEIHREIYLRVEALNTALKTLMTEECNVIQVEFYSKGGCSYVMKCWKEQGKWFWGNQTALFAN